MLRPTEPALADGDPRREARRLPQPRRPHLEAAMTATYPAVEADIASQDYIEGPKAFAERRKPEWQNR